MNDKYMGITKIQELISDDEDPSSTFKSKR